MVKGYCLDAITAIKQALAAPVQEPKMYEDWYDSSSCGHCGMVNGHRPECRHNYKTPAPAPVQEPVAWEDGSHLVVRVDVRDRLNYKGPWVDMGRAIPDKWIPVLYTTTPAAPEKGQP